MGDELSALLEKLLLGRYGFLKENVCMNVFCVKVIARGFQRKYC